MAGSGFNMRSMVFRGFAAVAALAFASMATAQSVSLNQQTGPAAPSAISAPGNSQPLRNATPAAEPASMAGMLAAQNTARQRIGLPPLTWSPELAAKAELSASAEAAGKCTINTVEKLARAEGVAVYWAAGLSQLGGAASVQTILPSFIVSEWSAGRPDYDLARHTCRRSGACDQYAKMVSPVARQVGCAQAICPQRSQVWICRYDDSAPPKPATSPAR
jgi:pathogenesis-related protein 1